MRLPWRPDNPCLAMLPMALLTAIVRKEALLPEHTAAFAATQLLPVIQAATDRHLAVAPRHCYHPDLCKEFLVSADMPYRTAAAACICRVPLARPMRLRTLCLYARSAMHGCALQMMCSYLATSSAWPVLLGHRDLITLAADMVLVTFSKGDPCLQQPVYVCRQNPHARHCLRKCSRTCQHACDVTSELLSPSTGVLGNSDRSPVAASAVSEKAAAAAHLARVPSIPEDVADAGCGVHICGGM